MFKAACVQLRSSVRVEDNTACVENLVREAADQGAQYIQTPEMSGLLDRDRKALFAKLRPQVHDPFIARCGELAAHLKIWLHIGSHAVLVDDGKAANRAFLFSPSGALLATYDKLHMFDVDLENGESWRESSAYVPGQTCPVVETPIGSIGLSICYDIRFPDLYRQQALAGAKLLTAPSSFTRQTGEKHWHVLMRARAVENGAWMLAAAQGGRHEDGRETFGHSMIVDPNGSVVAELGHDEPGICFAEVDLAIVDRVRKSIPNLANGRSFEVKRIG